MSDSSRGRTEVVPEVVFLGKLVERITAGKVRVPKFQRPFVWKQEDLHALLDSVLRGFPIGSILVWDTEEEVETAQHIGPVEVGPRPDGMIGYLLDGQQRVSTLVGTLQLPDGVPSIVDQVDWGIYCDLDRGEFLRAPAGGLEPQHFPMHCLLDTAGFFGACRHIESDAPDKELGSRWIAEADRLANAFRDYQLPVIHLREADLDSAVTVFARLNRTGRKMAADEMVSALTYREGEFHLAKKLDEFKEELDGVGFGNLDRVLLLRAVLAALDRDIYAKDWAKLMVQQEVRDRLPEVFDLAAEGIRAALTFLKELGVTSDRLLPYGLQLVLLGEFFRLCPRPEARVVELLERWFWVTSFTGWFGGVNTAQVRHALSDIRELAQGRRASLDVVDFDTPAQAFPERFDGRSARVRAFLLYLGSLQPRSFHGEILDLGRLLSSRGSRAVGYVSSNAGLLQELFSTPANRMFLNADQVGQAVDDLAALGEDQMAVVLQSHGFPKESMEALTGGDRVGLIGSRLGALISGERDFMSERNVSLPTERTAATIADSDASDDE